MMRTRYVSLLLGYAVLEDVTLWVVLAFATALAKPAKVASQHLAGTVSSHIIGTFVFMFAAMLVMPVVLRYVDQSALERDQIRHSRSATSSSF